jgi:putative effector of murein hydrolase
MMFFASNVFVSLALLSVLGGVSQGFTPSVHIVSSVKTRICGSTVNNNGLARRSIIAVSPYTAVGKRQILTTSRVKVYNEDSETTKVSDLWSTKTSSNLPVAAAVAVPTTIQSVSSALLLVILDVALRKYFKKACISFPSSLAGCGILFSFLVTLSSINNKLGDSVYNVFSPGALLLSKWLAVFFVPSLVTLPLAQPLGSALELAKVSFIVIFGFLFTLMATSWSVLGVRWIAGTTTPKTLDDNNKAAVPTTAKKPAYSASTLTALLSCAAASAYFSIAKINPTLYCFITKTNLPVSKIANTLLMLSSTLASFVFGARLPSNFTKVVHPLVTCTSLTWVVAKLLAVATSTKFVDQLRLYKTGSLTSLTTTGAGDILIFLLGPSVIALACQMYSRKAIMRQNVKEVAAAVIVGSSFGGLFGTALLVRLMKLSSSTLAVSLLPRNITSPLAMAIATLLGGADVSLAVSMVVISGLIGANFGASILDRAGIQDPVARGLGIGAAAHGLGTAAFINEKDAAPFAAIAMALTGSMSTVLVSIPAIRNLLLKIATGV